MSEEQLTGPQFAVLCHLVFNHCGAKWKLLYRYKLSAPSVGRGEVAAALSEDGFIYIGSVWIKGFDTLEQATLAKLKLPGGLQLADHSDEPWTLEART